MEKLNFKLDGQSTDVKEPEELIKYTDVPGTPFRVASTKNEVTDEPENYVLLGIYRISDSFESLEDAITSASTISWGLITSVIAIMIKENKEVLNVIESFKNLENGEES